MPTCALRLKCAACLSERVRCRRSGRTACRWRPPALRRSRLHPDHAGDRAEHFFAVDAHRRRRLGDERGRHVEAFGVALEPLAAGGELAAFLLRDLRRKRGPGRAGSGRRRDRCRCRPSAHRRSCSVLIRSIIAFHEAVVDAFGDDDAATRPCSAGRWRSTRSAAPALTATSRSASSSIDLRILAAHLELELLHRLDRGRGRCSCRSAPSP